MRAVVSLFLLLPLIAEGVREATRDESNWAKVKSYSHAVRRHPVNPNAISQVDSDDETRAVAYYYMIVNGTTIDREVRYFLSPFQVSAVGDLNIFFLPGPLANWARNIGNPDIDPSEILEKFPPVALDDLPPMPRMIRRKIRELTYGFDLLRSSGVSREKYAREKASIGSHRVQSVDNAVASTTVAPKRPARMIVSAPLPEKVFNKRKVSTATNIFNKEEQTIFESIVNDLVDHNGEPAKADKAVLLKPKPSNKVVRIGVKTTEPLVPRIDIKAASVVPTRAKFIPTLPTAPPTVDAALREFQFKPHSTPSTRSVDEYDQENNDEPEDDAAHELAAARHATAKRPTLDSDQTPRVSHPRTHSIERSRIKEILIGADDFTRATQRPRTTKRVQSETLSSAEIMEKLSHIRNLQEELERQLERKGLGRKRVEAAHPDPDLLDLEDLSAPDTFRTTHDATTTEEPTTTTEEPTITERPTTTTRRITTTTTPRPRPTTTRRPVTATRAVPPPPPLDDDVALAPPPPPPPVDPEFHSFHEDLVGVLATLEEDPHILPPLPSEVFQGHQPQSSSFFGARERWQRKEDFGPTTTRRPTTARPTTRRAPPPTTTTTTTTRRPTTTTTERTTTTTTEEPETTTEEPTTTSTRATLPTRKFVFVTSPPNTRRPSTTTTAAPVVPVPTVPEFVPDEVVEVSSLPAAGPSGDDVKIDLRTLRALTSLSNDEIDKIRRRFAEVDARATAAQLAPGQELDEAMFRGLEMMEDFEARAKGAKINPTLEEIALEDLTPMSQRFVPMGLNGRIATAAAVKTKNMDVEYEYQDDTVEESNQEHPGHVLVFDDDFTGAHIRDTRRIQHEPLRRFEKNSNRKKFVFVRPDRFYDKDGIELKKPSGVDEAQLSEAIGLGSGRAVHLVSNDHSFTRRPAHTTPAPTAPSQLRLLPTTTPPPLIGVPIHIAAVTMPTTTRRITPPAPVSTVPFSFSTRGHPRPPAHTPPVHLLPEQLQALQLASVHPVQLPHAAAVQFPSILTPPPRPFQQVVQPLAPSQQVPTLPSNQAVPVPIIQQHQLQQLQQLQQQQQARQQFQQNSATAVQQVVTPPPRVAQIFFNQHPVAATVQSSNQPAQHQQQPASIQPQPIVTVTVTSAPTTVAQTPAPTVPPTTTTTVAPTTTTVTTPASTVSIVQTTPAPTQAVPVTTTPTPSTTVAVTVAPVPTPSPFLPNPAFRNPIHPSIPFTPALNGLSVNQFLSQFFAQQQAIRAAAKQLQALQRAPKSIPEAPAQPAPAPEVPAVPQQLQYPPGFVPSLPAQYFWPPQPQFAPNPWFFPGQAFGAKTAQAGKPEPGDVITVSSDTNSRLSEAGKKSDETGN